MRMPRRYTCLVGLAWLACLLPQFAAAATPQLLLEPGGSTSYITSLEFSPDGQRLYAAGWDKTVRVWQRAENGNLQYQAEATLRVPRGSGMDGVLNAMAVSPDGRWLAVGGRSITRDMEQMAGERRLVPMQNATAEILEDIGRIFLFNTVTGAAFTVRGHRGPVVALAFAPSDGDALQLVSAGYERRDDAGGAWWGTLRAWRIDTTSGKAAYTAGHYLSQSAPVRPTLAVHPTGSTPSEAVVLVQWGDGIRRAWSVDRKEMANQPLDSARNDDTLALGSGGIVARGRVLQTASGWQSQIDLHQLRGAQQVPAGSIALPAQQDRLTVPRVLRWLPSQDGAAGQLAVIVALAPPSSDRGARPEYALWVVDSRGGVRQQIKLWSAGTTPFLPALATSPDDKLIAVADGARVRLYRNDGPRSQPTELETLQPAGRVPPYVQFMQRDGELGLAFSHEALRADRDTIRAELIFQPTDGRIRQSDIEQWTAAEADAAAWHVTTSGSEPLVVIHNQNTGRSSRVRLDAGHSVTAHAVLEHRGKVIVAVASLGGGEVLLDLYDVLSGQRLRRCTAHSLPIRALSFSEDARFLASAGDDTFACVWSLTEFDPARVSRGVPPVIISDTPDGPAVSSLQTGPEGLQPGDLLLGQVVGQTLIPWSSAADAYRTYWKSAPESELIVRRRRGGSVQDVTTTVLRQVDDVRPLFSLFLLPPEPPQRNHWQWIAWNPLGPFDASHDQAETLIGWHFNRGPEAALTAFATGEQYAAQFRRRGLLSELIERGQLPPQRQPEPAPLPQARLSILGATEQDGGRVRVQIPPEQVQMQLLFPAEQIETDVQLLVDGEAAGSFQPAGSDQWQAALPNSVWQPGRSVRLQARMRTREQPPQEFTAELQADYHPSPPVIEITSSDSPTIEDHCSLHVRVAPAVEGEAVEYQIVHEYEQQQTVLHADSTAQAVEKPFQVPLQTGFHRFVVEAMYAGYSAEQRPAHLERRVVTVTRLLEAEPLTRLKPELLIAPAESNRSAVPVLEDRPTRVHHDLVQLSGTVSAPQEIKEATWELGDRQGTVRVDPFTPGRPQRIWVDEPLPLNPGLQPLRIVARTAQDQRLDQDLLVDFRPPVPEVRLLEPQDGAELLEEAVTVVAEIQPADGLIDPPRLTINGRRLEATFDSNGRLLHEVPLELGSNRIEIAVTNRYNPEVHQDAVTVVHRRPPRIAKLSAAPQGDTPFARVDVVVMSPTKPIRFEVNRQVFPTPIVEAAGPQQWHATLSPVALQQGVNNISVAAYNGDGRSSDEQLAVTYDALPPEPPTVVFLNPPADTPTTAASFELRYLVRSATPLQSVRLLHNDQPLDVPAPASDAEDRQSPLVVHAITVELAAGHNRFELVAANEGGESRTAVNLSTPSIPVRVQVDDVVGDPDAPRTAAADPASTVFPPIPSARAWVRGRVVWHRPDEQLLDERLRVQVWVNGFQQQTVLLEPRRGEGQERLFSLPVVLNRADANLVEIRVPALVTGAASQLQVHVGCRQPDERYGVHLLVVGVGVRPEEESSLVKSALDALQAEPHPQNPSSFTTDTFMAGKIYGPVTGMHIQRAHVLQQLFEISETINSSPVRNNVVMIYYQGGEIMYDANRFFLTTRPPQVDQVWSKHTLQTQAIDSEVFHRFIAGSPGAHLLFLDVARGPSNAEGDSMLPADSRAGLIRFAWTRHDQTRQEGQLLSALQDALQPPSDLQKVESSLAERFVFDPQQGRLISRQFAEALLLEHFVPSPLQGLQLTQ